MKIKLAERFHPGDFIREEMEARGWDTEQMAREAGMKKLDVHLIITEQKGVTSKDAVCIGSAFGTSSELWTNLQKAYDDWE